MWIILVLMNAVLASMFVVDKVVLEYLPPLVYLSLRTIPAGLVCLAWYSRYALSGIHWPRRRETWYAILMSLCNVYLTNVFILRSLQTISAATAALLYNAKPFITALLAHLFRGERITRDRTIGLALGWIGFIPLVLFHGAQDTSAYSLIGLSSGELWALAGACAVSISYLFSSAMLHGNHALPLSFASGMNLLVGGCAAALTTVLADCDSWSVLGIVTSVGWLWLAVSIIQTIIWAGLFVWCMRHYQPASLAASSFMIPFVAVILEWLVGYDTVDLPFLLASCITAFGLLIFYRAQLCGPCDSTRLSFWCRCWWCFEQRG